MSAGERVADEGSSGGWSRHIMGVGLGVLVVGALIGHARLVHDLQTIGAREFVTWPQRVVVGLLFLWGIVLVLVARFAPRFPALPTTVALVLIYGAFASLPLLPRLLPLAGPWQPRIATMIGADTDYHWHGYALVLMAGAMTAAAVWGWWRYARDRQHGAESSAGEGPSEVAP